MPKGVTPLSFLAIVHRKGAKSTKKIRVRNSPLGRGFRVGKSVIREIFTEISRPKGPTPNPSQEGNNLCRYKTCPRVNGDMRV